jgi:hypothetical protein
VVALIFAGWVVRNDIQLGSPVTFTSNGFNLAAMYSTQAQQSGHFVDPVYDPRFGDLRLLQFDEVRWSRTLSDRGIAGLEHDPLYVFSLLASNSKAWFELVPTTGDSAERLDGRNITVRHWALPEFYLFTIGGIAGLVVTWRRRSTILLIAASLYFTAASLLLLAPPRLRAPFDLINCVGLGLLAAWWWRRRHQDEEATGHAALTQEQTTAAHARPLSQPAS